MKTPTSPGGRPPRPGRGGLRRRQRRSRRQRDTPQAAERRRRGDASSRSSPTPCRRSASTRSSRPSTRRPRARASRFSQSYGASGDQSRKVESGLPTDVVNFSVEPDVTRLVKSGLVDDELEPERAQGHPVRLGRHDRRPARATRRASQTWDDLLKPGVEVVTPNPFSSGSREVEPARALRREEQRRRRTREAGLAYLSKLIGDHVKVQPKSGREATETFLQGTGDVLLSYENEALFAERNGEDVEHHTPDDDVQDREPGRGRQHVQAPASRRRRSSTSCTRPRARRRGPRPASARSTRPSRRSSRPTSRRRRSSGRSTTSAAGARSTTSSSSRTTGSVAKIYDEATS